MSKINDGLRQAREAFLESDYTPTTEEVRDSYRYSNQRPDICGKDFGLEFDRWLAEEIAKAFEKFAEDSYEAYLVDPDLDWPEQPSQVAKWYKSAASKLRVQAEEYRKGAEWSQ